MRISLNDRVIWLGLAVSLTTAGLLLGCPPSTTAPPDAGQPAAPPPPPQPDPVGELAALVRQGEEQLAQADPRTLQELDTQLYDRCRGLDPNLPQVKAAGELRGKIKVQLIPANIALAEASFKAGRYDDAARQASYVPDTAPVDLVKRKKAILDRMPGILQRRAACAKQWPIKACRIVEEHPNWPMTTAKALAEGAIGLDMTPEQVRVSWGDPVRVETKQEKGQLQVFWYFQGTAFVVFTGPHEKGLKVFEVSN